MQVHEIGSERKKSPQTHWHIQVEWFPHVSEDARSRSAFLPFSPRRPSRAQWLCMLLWWDFLDICGPR